MTKKSRIVKRQTIDCKKEKLKFKTTKTNIPRVGTKKESLKERIRDEKNAQDKIKNKILSTKPFWYY